MSIFPSTLIIGSSPQIARDKAINLLSSLGHKETNNPDIFIIDDYTINSVRSLKKFLSQKPFNHQNKTVLIPEAENLNQESQNALLKTLEEPGEGNYIILTSINITKLLPTIVSRCQKIKINTVSQKSQVLIWPITGNAKKDLDFANTITDDKNKIKDLLTEQLEAYQQLLISSPDSKNTKIVKNLIAAIDLINNNVDPKNALDYFFLK